MWLKKTVAAVIPASADKNSIFSVIQELDATGYLDEVIVVDNGVDSETLKQIKKTRARFLKQKKYGLGRAIKAGIKKTKADLVIITDSRGTFKGGDIAKLLSYSEDFDIVFGSRTHASLVSKGSGMTLWRRLMNDLLGKMISILFLSSNLTDVRCSLRLTNRKGWRRVVRECYSDSDIFLTEWLTMAAKNKVKFIEIPVNFTAPKAAVGKENLSYLIMRGLFIFWYILKTWLIYLISKLN